MKELTAVILAGGKSRRMGTDKAELGIDGKSFVSYLAGKLYKMGIKDILLSGYEKPVEHTRYVPDILPGCGPLAGIHAGLCEAVNPHVLVLPADNPLIPVEFILKLCKAHEDSTEAITAAECGGRIQPLTAVYEKSLAGACSELISSGRLSVMSLFDAAGYKTVRFDGDEMFIRGCNTPEEYAAYTRTG
ncbi:MAG: molybdenum cofactor guanylyltransferase [Lachnospiraceae bacterium]|nr:molybdenum cofactor guanylyltransferase [Lachnospiraceae bacterium]